MFITKTKIWIPLTVALSISNVVHAEKAEETDTSDVTLEETVTENDPSDVTRPQTFLKFESGFKGKDADTRLQLNIAGQYSPTNSYLVVLEGHLGTNIDANAEHGKSPDYGLSKFRGRYFQVMDTGTTFMPKLGVSIDYIKNGNDWVKHATGTVDTVAIGTVGKLGTGFDNWNSFPNLAVMENKYDNGKTGKGWQANWFNSVYVGDSGLHFGANPQYSNFENADGQNQETLQMELKVTAPLYSDKFWGSVTYSEFFASDSDDSRMRHLDGNQELRLGVNWFF